MFSNNLNVKIVLELYPVQIQIGSDRYTVLFWSRFIFFLFRPNNDLSNFQWITHYIHKCSIYECIFMKKEKAQTICIDFMLTIISIEIYKLIEHLTIKKILPEKQNHKIENE